jgi:transposase
MQTPSSLNQLSHAEKDALILMLQEQIKALKEVVKQLQSQLHKNSRCAIDVQINPKYVR